MAETSPPAPGPPPAGRDLTWPTVAVVFVAFWVVYLIVAGPPAVDDLDAPAPGTAVGYDWSLEDLDGKPVPFERFRGKALFVNVWATWCGPCIQEMPSIARLAARPEFQGDALEFVCIATDDDVADVKRYTAAKGWPMTLLHARELPAALLTDGIPATFFVAADGKIAYARVGSADWDEPKVVAKLRSLAEQAPKPAAAGAG